MIHSSYEEFLSYKRTSRLEKLFNAYINQCSFIFDKILFKFQVHVRAVHFHATTQQNAFLNRASATLFQIAMTNLMKVSISVVKKKCPNHKHSEVGAFQ